MTATPLRRLLLGITGGIAAYKAAELTRLLAGQGVEARVVMTAAACRFITPVTMQALSGQPVFTDLWDERIGNGMGHIQLAREADAILVAPASADFLARLAHGMANDLLSTLCLARGACPLLVAPAMNVEMWRNPATQRNIALLQGDGVVILGPASGEQACGETGLGRMLEPVELLEALEASRQPKLLAGRKVLLTAGPTFEALDAVRGITNLSSGKMGYAIARAALEMGADVTLVSGPVSEKPPAGAKLVGVTSASQMLDAVLANLAGQDIFIGVAAVADYTVARPHAHKLKKGDASLNPQLTPTTDILATVAARPDAPFCVGFAAESENLLRQAEEKRRRKKLPLLAANLVGEALGADDNTVVLLDGQGAHPLPRAPKLTVARQLLSHIAGMLSAQPPIAGNHHDAKS